jgi:hypothetical protein
MLTGVGAAAYVMSRGDSPQGDSSRTRPVVDVTTIPPTAHGYVEPTEPTVRKVSSTRPGDGDMRLALTRDLQRELKRVGCYDGEIDGHWGTGSRMAMKTFTERVNATLPVDEADYILLALVQGQKDKACGKCPPGQGFAENGRCLPSALLAQAAKQALSKREPSATENTRALAERIEPATTTWTATATTPTPSTPAPPIEGRLAVGGPGAETPSPSNATGRGNGGVKVADLPPEGTQSEGTSRASHPTHGPGRIGTHDTSAGRKAEVASFQARRPPSVVRRSAPKSDDKGWDNYKPANWVNGTPVY